MNRLKPYDVPHKGLRNALSQLSLQAGKTDYSNRQEVERLYKLGKDVFTILRIHSEDENTVTLAELEARCPGCSQHDFDDHEQLHILQNALEKMLAAIYGKSQSGIDAAEEGAEFYRALTIFHGKYLEHTAEEEQVTQPLLWQFFTDEELAAQRGKIMSRNPPETLLIWFRFVIPAQSHKERVGLLAGFKKMASPAFFSEGMNIIKLVLTPQEFDNLDKSL